MHPDFAPREVELTSPTVLSALLSKLTIVQSDSFSTTLGGLPCWDALSQRLEVFEPKPEGALPVDVRHMRGAPNFESLTALLVRENVDWIKLRSGEDSLAGCFLSPERKVVAEAYFNKMIDKMGPPEMRCKARVSVVERLGVVQAPRGHGKTHFKCSETRH